MGCPRTKSSPVLLVRLAVLIALYFLGVFFLGESLSVLFCYLRSAVKKTLFWWQIIKMNGTSAFKYLNNPRILCLAWCLSSLILPLLHACSLIIWNLFQRRQRLKQTIKLHENSLIMMKIICWMPALDGWTDTAPAVGDTRSAEILSDTKKGLPKNRWAKNMTRTSLRC